MNKKGDARVTLGLNNQGTEIQGAYSISDKFGLLLNGFSVTSQDEHSDNGGSGKYLELGLGKIHSNNRFFAVDFYVLGGIGTLENHFPTTLTEYPESSGELKSTLYRYGVYNSLGFTSKYFDAAFSTRLSALHYTNIRGNLMYDHRNQQKYLRDRFFNILWEPAITLRAGFDPLKIQFQFGFSKNYMHPDLEMDKEFARISIWVGGNFFKGFIE